MEHQKGQSNDTESRASNASSTRDQESTGFSATPDDPLSSPVFNPDRLEAHLGWDSEFDIALRSQTTPLWSQTQLHACLPSEYQRQIIMMQQARDNYGAAKSTNFNLPLENIYDPLFQFPSGGPASLQTAPGPTSPRVMASKLLDMHGYVRGGGGASSSSSSGNHVESDASLPAGKKMRSLRAPPTGKHEFPSPEPYSFHQSEAQPGPGNPYYFAEMDRQPWMCTSEENVRPAIGARQQLGSTVMGARELNTMEQLLVQCATALEASDFTYAQQTIFVINNIAAVDGDPNQRLLAHFLRALILRASKVAPHLLSGSERESLMKSSKLKTVLELTNYIDVMPWYRFGFTAANGAILDAFEGKEKVHILDFNISHCMQWPTLIEALAERSEGPPQVRLTVCVSKAPIPPLLEVPYDDLIMRLAKFARSKNVPFEYELLVEDLESLDLSKISIREGEILAVNCLFRLHYVSDEAQSTDQASCPRDKVLMFIRNLNPAIVTLTEEDAYLTSPKLVPRLRSAFNYLWIPFDALHTLLPNESQQRRHCEDEVANKIENLVACEGEYRIERVETKDRWVQRMRRARFEMIAFNEDVVAENRLMLGEHSGCWGLRKDGDEDVLFLTWKGHNVSFATAWVPVDLVNLPVLIS
ncbi:hypothetical protein M758_2G172400 [Ceratodon purpureus]|nr:hypothetical protein M758_2G172400 [Ceratodon purpureus]